MKPVMGAAASSEAREDELVASARAGSSEAFEALFRRYRDRITGFVRANVRDESRVEDVVQEVFFAAHKSLPTLEQPDAFRPWLYQIARNACLDEARRRSRQDALLLGWDEFPPPDERIVVHNQPADRALSQKEELTTLTEALDGLPKAQQDALVLRELEGRSYEEIGRRMRLSRAAVESVLFRARRGLRGEYAEIETGERCNRMQAVMAQIAEGMGDLGQRRKLIRHMRGCHRCRNEAAALGLTGLAVPSSDRNVLGRAFSRVAALVPLPAFFSRRAADGEQLSSGASLAAQAQNAAAHFGAVGGDHAASAIHKAAAVVAAVAVVGGGGVAMHEAGVKLPVKIPVVGEIGDKSDDAGEGAAAAGSGGGPPSPGNSGPSAGGPPGAVPGPLSRAGAGQAPAAATPLDPSAPAASPVAGSPPASAPDTTGVPDGSKPSDGTPGDPAPSAGGGSGTGGTQPESGTGGGGGSGGGSKPAGGKKNNDSTTTPAPASLPAELQVLPPGLVNQILSGKRTVDELPPGQKKKLTVPADPTAPAG